MKRQINPYGDSFFWESALDLQLTVCEGHREGEADSWVGILTNLNVLPFQPFYKTVLVRSDDWNAAIYLGTFFMRRFAIASDPESTLEDIELLQRCGLLITPKFIASDVLTPPPTQLVQEVTQTGIKRAADRIFDWARCNSLAGERIQIKAPDDPGDGLIKALCDLSIKDPVFVAGEYRGLMKSRRT